MYTLTSLVRTMKTHHLKCWPEFFNSIANGEKKFELRFDDRGYKAGDILVLNEWQPGTKEFTGRSMAMTVTYLLGGFGLAKGWVCMSLDQLAGAGKVINDHVPDDKQMVSVPLKSIKEAWRVINELSKEQPNNCMCNEGAEDYWCASCQVNNIMAELRYHEMVLGKGGR